MDSLLLAIGVTCFAACLQGVAGFGAGLISMGVLASVWSVPKATAIMLPLGVLLNVSLIIQRRQTVELSSLKWVFIGLPLGVFFGVHLLEVVAEKTLKLLLGLALCASVVNTVINDRKHRGYSSLLAFIAGTFAGMSGSAFSASGPPILIYANLQGWDRDLYRAQLSALFMTSSLLALIGLSIGGQVDVSTLSISLTLTPGVLLGSFIGTHLGSSLPQSIFRYLVLGLLIALSARFLFNSL
jgi:uncharacterized protein